MRNIDSRHRDGHSKCVSDAYLRLSEPGGLLLKKKMSHTTQKCYQIRKNQFFSGAESVETLLLDHTFVFLCLMTRSKRPAKEKSLVISDSKGEKHISKYFSQAANSDDDSRVTCRRYRTAKPRVNWKQKFKTNFFLIYIFKKYLV